MFLATGVFLVILASAGLRSGGTLFPCVIDGFGDTLHALIDLDGDGDFATGAKRFALDREVIPGRPSVRGTIVEGDDARFWLGVAVGEDGRAVQRFGLDRSGLAQFGGILWSDDTRRRGRVDLGDREVSFVLLGNGAGMTSPERRSPSTSTGMARYGPTIGVPTSTTLWSESGVRKACNCWA